MFYSFSLSLRRLSLSLALHFVSSVGELFASCVSASRFAPSILLSLVSLQSVFIFFQNSLWYCSFRVIPYPRVAHRVKKKEREGNITGRKEKKRRTRVSSFFCLENAQDIAHRF